MNYKLILGCLIGTFLFQPEQEVIRTTHLVMNPELLPKTVTVKKTHKKQHDTFLTALYYFQDGKMHALPRKKQVQADLMFSHPIKQSEAYLLKLRLEEFDVTGLDVFSVYDAVLAQFRFLTDVVSSFDFWGSRHYQFTSCPVQFSSRKGFEIRLSSKSDNGTELNVIYLTSEENRLLIIYIGDSEERNEQHLADIERMIEQIKGSISVAK